MAKPDELRTAKPCGPGRRCYGQAFAEMCASPTGWTASSIRRAREASRNSAPGRAWHKPSDHCAGKAVCLASPVCRCAVFLRVLSHSGPWVPAGTRPSLRPLSLGGRRTEQSSGEMRREDAKVCLRLRCGLEKQRCPLLRHCERSEAIQSASAEGFWIASRRSQCRGGGGMRPHLALAPRTQRNAPSAVRCRAGTQKPKLPACSRTPAARTGARPARS